LGTTRDAAATRNAEKYLRAWWRETARAASNDEVTFPYVAWRRGVAVLPLAAYRQRNALYVKHAHGR